MATENGQNKTDFTVTETVKTTAHHDGNKVDFKTDTDRDVTGQIDPAVYKLVNGMVEKRVNALMEERETRENIRANHRNLNRMLTLFGALFIGLALTYLFQHGGIPGIVKLPRWMITLAPYTFVITIAMDSGLALYGLIKHY